MQFIIFNGFERKIYYKDAIIVKEHLILCCTKDRKIIN